MAKFESLDLTKMSDSEVNKFLDNNSMLTGATPNHGYDYIQRSTGNFGTEHYFSIDVFGNLKIE